MSSSLTPASSTLLTPKDALRPRSPLLSQEPSTLDIDCQELHYPPLHLPQSALSSVSPSNAVCCPCAINNDGSGHHGSGEHKRCIDANARPLFFATKVAPVFFYVFVYRVLANAITVASAAIVDARVDCLGLISGGVAAVVQSQPQDDDETESARSQSQSQAQQKNLSLVLDPTPPEHSSAILAAAVVGYMPASDELTEVWLRGNIPAKKGLDHEALIDGAVEAARAVQAGVLGLAVLESAERQRGVEGVAAEGR
ncbi:3'-5'-exoribonuclease [Ascosphaera atra]|nr:3'-5'-exoribonuclease [Ascosphaera atra]